MKKQIERCILPLTRLLFTESHSFHDPLLWFYSQTWNGHSSVIVYLNCSQESHIIPSLVFLFVFFWEFPGRYKSVTECGHDPVIMFLFISTAYTGVMILWHCQTRWNWCLDIPLLSCMWGMTVTEHYSASYSVHFMSGIKPYCFRTDGWMGPRSSSLMVPKEKTTCSCCRRNPSST